MLENIPVASRHIRVAELRHGHFNDEIVIILHPESLGSGNLRRYEALSYAWGSKDSQKPVWIKCCASGRKVLVTCNLDVALRHLRYLDQPRYLWVDSICIDQSDKVEKAI